MKKYIESLLLLCVTAFALTSCGDDENWTVGPQADGVYFPNTVESTIELSLNENSFEIPLMRTYTEGDQVVNLTVTGGEGIYNIPTSASFADGENSTSLTVTYDPSQVEYDVYTEITINIADEDITPYGLAEYKFQVGLPAPWESLGMCTYTDDIIGPMFGLPNYTYQVELQENQVQPGFYRLVNPYGAAFPGNQEGGWDTTQDWYLEIHAENPDRVYINLQETGTSWEGYGMFTVGSMAGYMLEGGTSEDEVAAQGLFGTLRDGIITFPTQALLLNMSEYNPSSLYYANNNGAFRVVLPGVEVSDYTLTVAYAGKYTDENGEDAGVSALLSEVGEDVTSVRLAVVEGLDPSAAIQGITDGSLESTTVTPTAGDMVRVPFSTTPEDGEKYSIVAVAFDGEESQTSSYATFIYHANSAAHTWTQIGVGDYTYSAGYFGTEEEPYLDEGLNVYRCDQDPTLYRIENWGAGTNFEFAYDSNTGRVTVLDQEIDMNSNYGTVFAQELANYVGNDSFGNSYYENGTFHFNIVYYCGAGELGFGYETFTIATSDSGARNKAMKKSAKNLKAKTTTVKKSSSLRSQRPVMTKVFKR